MNNEWERMWEEADMAYLGTMLAFACRYWGKPHRISVRI